MSEHRTIDAVCECGHMRAAHDRGRTCAGCYHTSLGKNVGCKRFRVAEVQPDVVLEDPRVLALVGAAREALRPLTLFGDAATDKCACSDETVETGATDAAPVCEWCAADASNIQLRAALQPFVTRE